MNKKKHVSKNYMECVFTRSNEITWSENDSFCIVLDVENKFLSFLFVIDLNLYNGKTLPFRPGLYCLNIGLPPKNSNDNKYTIKKIEC